MFESNVRKNLDDEVKNNYNDQVAVSVSIDQNMRQIIKMSGGSIEAFGGHGVNKGRSGKHQTK